MISWTNLLKQSQRNSSFNGCPAVVVWNITSRCNLECKHCYFDAKNNSDFDELTTAQARDFIDDLAGLGVEALLFSGGEPLLRKDIFELAQFAKTRNIKTTLSTNGTLINKEVAKKIKKAGFSYVGISLDGKEQIHDLFRGQKGAFRLSLAGIRNCKESGLKVGLRFTLTKYNLKDLPFIFQFVKEESIPRLCIYHLVYTGRGNNLKDRVLTNEEIRCSLELIWRKINEFIKKGIKTEILTVDNHADGAWIYLKLRKIDSPCAQKVLEILKSQGGNASGTKIACVDNRGEVYPDQFWRTHSLGSIKKNNFSKTWQDKNNTFLKALRNRRHLLKGRCQKCNYLVICNGNFRARAEAMTGDMWAPDPACYLTDEEIVSSLSS